MLQSLAELKEAKERFGSIDGIPEEISCQLFWNFAENDGLQDDLLFFASNDNEIQVCRFVCGGPRPSINIKVDWTGSLILNLICQMNFSLKISSCSYIEGEIKGMSQLMIEDVAIKKVYAGPIECHLDHFFETRKDKKTKKNHHKISKYSYPEIYFSVQDFDTCFQDIVIRKDSILIVELFVTPDRVEEADSILETSNIFKRTESLCIFQGAISYDALKGAFHANVKEFGALRGSFIMMAGPDGIGEAQLNAKNIQNSGNENDEITLKSAFKRLKSIISTDEAVSRDFLADQEPIFNCRLTFIRLHLMNVIKLLL